jgi:NodT family efflux transporter outer membrane factor (OMF) lipoprotein
MRASFIFHPSIVGLACAVSLSACSTLPDRTPELQAAQAGVPAHWTNGSNGSSQVSQSTSVATSSWWVAAGDATLNGLVQQALDQNISLAVAAQRVYQAQRRLAQAQTQQGPQAQGQASVSATQALQSDAPVTRRATASVGVSWEIDVWQRLAAQANAADAALVAAAQDQESVRQSLVAMVVRQYWQWAFAGQRVMVAEQNLAVAQQTSDLMQAKYRAGAVSGLAKAQTLQALATQEASLAQWRSALEEARQTLALLLGQAPQAVRLPTKSALPNGLPPVITPGLPATVLACRPDVRAAQARLQQTWSLEDAATRQWYPAITLTGSVSGSSTALTDVLKDPLGAVSAAITLPFLQWRERQQQIDLASSDANVALLNFQSTMYQALSDVDKALVLQVQLKKQLAAQQSRFAQSQTIERLTRARYQAGADTLQMWLDAQQSLRQSELDAAQAGLNAWTQWANAMVALGDGGCAFASK